MSGPGIPADAPPRSPGRVEWLDALRGFAMWCVVMGHPDGADPQLKVLLYAFHMPLFFMISGALFRYEKYASLAACAKDQAKKLLFPYLMLSVVCAPLWYANRVVLGDTVPSPARLAYGFAAADQYVGQMVNGALWFLPTLFLTTVAFWWIVDLDRRGRVDLAGSLGVCAVLALGAGALLDGEHTVWNVSGIPLILLYYWFGHEAMRLYRRRRADLEGLDQPRAAAAIIVLLALGAWAGTANTQVNLLTNDYKSPALLLVSSLAISLGLALALMRLPRIAPLSFAGRYSLDYLGLHVPLMRFLETWEVTAGFAQRHAFVLGVAVILLLMPVIHVIERFAPVLMGRWPSPRSGAARRGATRAR